MCEKCNVFNAEISAAKDNAKLLEYATNYMVEWLCSSTVRDTQQMCRWKIFLEFEHTLMAIWEMCHYAIIGWVLLIMG